MKYTSSWLPPNKSANWSNLTFPVEKDVLWKRSFVPLTTQFPVTMSETQRRFFPLATLLFPVLDYFSMQTSNLAREKYGENFAPSFVPSWTLKSCFELNPSRSWRVKSLLRNDLLKFVARCFLQVEEKYSTIFHRIIPPIFFISIASSICSIIDIVIFNWSLKCCLWTLDIRVRDNKIIRFFQILLYIIILLYI